MSELYGNAIIGQSGGPTAAINATLSGVIRGALDSKYIDKVYGARNGVEGMLSGNIVDLGKIFDSEKKLETLEHTPAAGLGSCRLKLPKEGESEEKFETLFKFFSSNNIRYFFYIGGNDSMDTVAKVSKYAKKINYEIRVMGVPKTIDNDVCGTDHTPGYGSAAKYIATSISEIIKDCSVYTVRAVTIVEIMGRDAGWLTAAAALTKKNGICPDLIYLPERNFSYEEFFEDLNAAFEKHPYIVVAVSEGIHFADGTLVGASAQSGVVDAFGHAYLSGTGKALEQAVKNKLGCKVRSVELSILQRCAAHIASKTDLEESVMVGKAAVKCAEEGGSGRMMNLNRVSSNPYICEAGSEEIDKIANYVKNVPDNFINERGNGITDECIDYMLPLVEGESFPEYKNGIPVFFTI